MAEIKEAASAEAMHAKELQALVRCYVKPVVGTPWGIAQLAQQYGEGIIYYSTAGHGGFHLDELANAQVHPLYRTLDGWYEQDCEWAKVAHAFPDRFTAFERLTADRTLQNVAPDAYEAIHGVVLTEGASYRKDRQTFDSKHRNDWVVIAAINSEHAPGMVECIASIGGNREGRGERRYLVSMADYETRKFAFVIDPCSHHLYEGPSSFVTWAARS